MRSDVTRKQGEKGFVLIMALLMLLVLTLIGVSGISSTNFEVLISGNKRISEKAFYSAEAGVHELIGRFRRAGATQEITDSSPSIPAWRIFLATSGDKVKQISGSPSQTFIPSVQNLLGYTVEVRHKLDKEGNVKLNEDGVPDCIATSHGYTPEGGNRGIEVEISKTPVSVPAALYSKAPVKVSGTSTHILGDDQCGSLGKFGVISTSTIDPGTAEIIGTPYPTEENSTKNLDLVGMVDALKGAADYTYDSGAAEDLERLAQDLKLNNWGTPTTNGDTPRDRTTRPLSYDGQPNIVYCNWGGDKTLKLSGGTQGAGILLVNGNLEVSGGFTWYGEIIVTGSFKITGGGEQNVTGGVLAGKSTTVTVDTITDVKGDVGILYCSSAIEKLRRRVPYRIVQWRELYE